MAECHRDRSERLVSRCALESTGSGGRSKGRAREEQEVLRNQSGGLHGLPEVSEFPPQHQSVLFVLNSGITRRQSHSKLPDRLALTIFSLSLLPLSLSLVGGCMFYSCTHARLGSTILCLDWL